MKSQYGYMAYNSGSTGVVTVDGAGSAWTSSNLYVGYYGNGTLDVVAVPRSATDVSADSATLARPGR